MATLVMFWFGIMIDVSLLYYAIDIGNELASGFLALGAGAYCFGFLAQAVKVVEPCSSWNGSG